MQVARIIFLMTILAGSATFAARPKETPAPKPHPTIEELLPPPTDHPEKREWFITTYVKGTPAQVKATLDKEAIEFAKKIGDAQRELKNSQRRLDEQKQLS